MNDRLLGEISVALSDIVALLEKDGDAAADTAIVQALNAIAAKIGAPQINVTPEIHFAPEISVQPASVTVQPAEVVIMPAVEAPRGWKLTVTARDENGSIRSLSLKPE